MSYQRWTVFSCFVLATAVFVTGCSANASRPSADQSSSQSSQSTESFSQSDLMFAQMMVPHHQQAIDMSALAESRSTNQGVLDLSRRISAAQAPEITQMNGWLSESGVGTDMGMDHSMHMSGVLSPDEMAKLSAATGTEFDRLYLEGMIRHHEAAIDMVQMILDSRNEQVRKLGENIVTSQTAEIAEMKDLLAELT